MNIWWSNQRFCKVFIQPFFTYSSKGGCLPENKNHSFAGLRKPLLIQRADFKAFITRQPIIVPGSIDHPLDMFQTHFIF